jgi:hypothetical protein
LKALLPDASSDIKGNKRSYDKLLEVSGYDSCPNEFDDLIRSLDRELRLISPVVSDGSESEGQTGAHLGEKSYLLTHDYLVPSIRTWVTRQQQATQAGRAQLMLDDAVARWKSKAAYRTEESYYLNPFEVIEILTHIAPETFNNSEADIVYRSYSKPLSRFVVDCRRWQLYVFLPLLFIYIVAVVSEVSERGISFESLGYLANTLGTLGFIYPGFCIFISLIKYLHDLLTLSRKNGNIKEMIILSKMHKSLKSSHRLSSKFNMWKSAPQ